MKDIIIKQDNQVFVMNEAGEFVCAHNDHFIDNEEIDMSYDGEHNTYDIKVWQCADCPAWQDVTYHWDGELMSPNKYDWDGEL